MFPAQVKVKNACNDLLYNIHDIDALNSLPDFDFKINLLLDAKYDNGSKECIRQLLLKNDVKFYTYDDIISFENVFSECLEINEQNIFIGSTLLDSNTFSQYYNPDGMKMYCPDDASYKCKEYADGILNLKSGEGCIAEFIYCNFDEES